MSLPVIIAGYLPLTAFLANAALERISEPKGRE
jgi:hypothetical protein